MTADDYTFPVKRRGWYLEAGVGVGKVGEAALHEGLAVALPAGNVILRRVCHRLPRQQELQVLQPGPINRRHAQDE
jgi:hypothetical protein